MKVIVEAVSTYSGRLIVGELYEIDIPHEGYLSGPSYTDHQWEQLSFGETERYGHKYQTVPVTELKTGDVIPNAYPWRFKQVVRPYSPEQSGDTDDDI